jgi:hypothetical protein
VYDDHVGIGKDLFELKVGIKDCRGQFRVKAAISVESCLSVILQEVLQAPGSPRLIGDDRMSTVSEFTQNSTQEMRVPMVPA